MQSTSIDNDRLQYDGELLVIDVLWHASVGQWHAVCCHLCVVCDSMVVSCRHTVAQGNDCVGQWTAAKVWGWAMDCTCRQTFGDEKCTEGASKC
jgi:hypothetical protein